MVQNRPPLHVSLNNFVTRPTTFWPSGQGCQKSVYIFKLTSRDRAEIQYGQRAILDLPSQSAQPLSLNGVTSY